MYTSMLLTFFSFISCVLSSTLNTPCRATDLPCFEKLCLYVRAKVIDGIPELEIKPSDPFFFEEIEGNLSMMKYKFFNTTISGYKNCILSNLKILNNITSFHYDLNCPELSIIGTYKMKGQLISVPMEGNGDFELITGNYFVHVDYEMDKYKGKDGKIHLVGKEIKLKCVPQTALKFDFKNLFNGQKDLSDAALKFAHENWREVAEFIQDPIWQACIKKYYNNMNKFLANSPLEDFLVF